MAYDEKLPDRFRTVWRTRKDVEEKRMFGGIAFMVRGHTAAGIVGSSLMVRLVADDAEGFLKENGARVMDFTGRPMRGFLFVDEGGIATAPALRKWLARAVVYAESQPVKAGKRGDRLHRSRPV